MCDRWSAALRYWRSTAWTAVVLLAGCAGEKYDGSNSPIVGQSSACQAFAQAWVEHFRANVAALGDHRGEVARTRLAQARSWLRQMETNEDCHKPYCLIQPKSEGRLDTYCGYRISDPTGAELYRWVPWTDLN